MVSCAGSDSRSIALLRSASAAAALRHANAAGFLRVLLFGLPCRVKHLEHDPLLVLPLQSLFGKFFWGWNTATVMSGTCHSSMLSLPPYDVPWYGRCFHQRTVKRDEGFVDCFAGRNMDDGNVGPSALARDRQPRLRRLRAAFFFAGLRAQCQGGEVQVET